jgi:Protein of unknown function (DUF3422)
MFGFSTARCVDNFENNFLFTHNDNNVVCFFGNTYHADGDDIEVYKSEPFHFALEDARESDNKILSMRASWGGLSIVVRCEFHSEYFTATRFVTVSDLSRIPNELFEAKSGLEHLSRLVPASLNSEEKETEQAHIHLYLRFWELLGEKLFHWNDLFERVAETRRLRIFADFRGLVMPAAEGTEESPPLALTMKRDEIPQKFTDTYAIKQLLPSIWPFLKIKNGLDLKRREFTASFMLDRRAVYITALGPQPPADDQFDCAPLQYFLVARPTSDWQLGALVDRLHFMGTVRLAALMELSSLRKAGANLRDMEKEVDAARRSLEEDDLDAALSHHQSALKLLAHTDNNGPIFWAGLQFRVERSRYYVQRFKDFVEFLGIDAIEGYQRYDYFVKGRLGGVYDYIDRLGRRQERAFRSTESIYQLISLKANAAINQKIVELTRLSTVANVQSAEANHQNAVANRQNSITSMTIEKLQTKAEIALLAVIVPHYAIEIMKELGEMQKTHPLVFRLGLGACTVGATLSVTSLYTFLSRKLDRGESEEVFHIVRKYFAFFIVATLVMIWYAHG